VLAGAGSGKTRVITQKIAYLITECGFNPHNIAAITFTNKAAKEMLERITKLMGGRGHQGADGVHLPCPGVRIVRQEAKLLGLKPQFSILDARHHADHRRDDRQHRQEPRQGPAVADLQLEERPHRAQRGRPPGQRRDLSSAALLYRDYDKTLRAYQGVDFDDLIRLPVKLFDEHPEVRERWQNRLRYLLVDEYQDTNRAQYRLLKLLAGVRAAFTAVGDDDQAIYAWRGADIENLRQLPVDYPNLRVIKLEQNYRSTTRILHAANTVIANNEKLFDKKLWSEHGAGEPVTVVACQTPSTRPNRW
jgi:ATP-dependent DNA helicase Rep